MTDGLSPTRTRKALRDAAPIALDVLSILLIAAIAFWALGKTWSVGWPVMIALLLTTLTWPAARMLRRLGRRPAPAAAAVTVVFPLAAAGTGVGAVAQGVVTAAPVDGTATQDRRVASRGDP